MSNLLINVLPWVAIFGIFWFLFIRPQRKQQKEHEELVANLKAGDKVVTIGGIKGEVTEVNEEDLKLKITSNTEVEMLKSAIRSLDEQKDSKENDSEDSNQIEEEE